MLIYFVFFAITLLFIFISEKFIRNNKNRIGITFGVIGIIILSCFFSLRDETVGTDVLVYIKPYLEYIYSYGLPWLLEYSDCELLYALLTNFVVLINGNLQTLLFLISFIISSLVYFYAYKTRNSTSIFFVFLVYLFIISGLTLNIARQSIAMAIVLYSMVFLRENKLLKFIFSIFIASGFHVTALFAILLYPIYVISGKEYDSFVKFLIIIILAFVFLYLDKLIEILNLFSDKYTYEYFEKFMFNGININITASLCKLFIMVCLLIVCRALKLKDVNIKEKKYLNFCAFLLILDFILFQFGAIINFTERISYYFMIISYSYLIPKIYSALSFNYKNKILAIILIFLLCIIYWLIMYYYLGVSSIIPFVFA